MATDPETESSKPEKCGVVMPISAIDGCPESHWLDVCAILYDAIQDAGFDPNLVSNADDIGIIQKRIIQNLYQNRIVVCDVSAKNPNVMFELGIRLAFDKPTIIVKDDKTSYSFDTSPIEHLTYPRDLRFSQIVDFKEQLATRIKATHHAATTDPHYTTFLKHFGTFAVAKLDSKEVSADELILSELRELRASIMARPSRHELDVSPFPKVALPQYAPVLERFSREIRNQVKERGLTRKNEIRAAQEEISRSLEPKLGPEFFTGHKEYESFFNSVFAILYE